MKVLFIIDSYIETAGASSAMRNYILKNSQLEEPVIFCENINTKGDSCRVPVFEADGKQIINFYLTNKYQAIHCMRANSWRLFEEVTKIIKKRNLQIPIITTVCQQPDFRGFFFSPYEIDNSDKIVFIDKTAYNSSFFKCIPTSKKEMIYFSTRKKKEFEIFNELSSQYVENKDCLVIGRASALYKCPDNMFEVFDKIDYPKKFVIIGNGRKIKEWILSEGAKRDYEVIVKDAVPYDDFLEEVNKFDIFLYHLPTNAYSSIDGTLGAAMLLKKPVVYLGPDAPKERFHGKEYNGYVADTVEEAAMYVNRLMHDHELRKTMGQRAHDTSIEDFNGEKTFEKYNKLYRELIENGKHPGGASISFKCFYLKNIAFPIYSKAAINKILRLCHIGYQLDIYA